MNRKELIRAILTTSSIPVSVRKICRMSYLEVLRLYLFLETGQDYRKGV